MSTATHLPVAKPNADLSHLSDHRAFAAAERALLGAGVGFTVVEASTTERCAAA